MKKDSELKTVFGMSPSHGPMTLSRFRSTLKDIINSLVNGENCSLGTKLSILYQLISEITNTDKEDKDSVYRLMYHILFDKGSLDFVDSIRFKSYLDRLKDLDINVEPGFIESGVYDNNKMKYIIQLIFIPMIWDEVVELLSEPSLESYRVQGRVNDLRALARNYISHFDYTVSAQDDQGFRSNIKTWLLLVEVEINKLRFHSFRSNLLKHS